MHLNMSAFISAIPKIFGELVTVDNSSGQTLTNQNEYYKIIQWGAVAHATNINVSSADGYIIVITPGLYKIQAALSFTGVTSGSYLFSLFINNLMHDNCKAQEQTPLVGPTENIPLLDINQLNAGDILDIRVQCTSAAGTNFILRQGSFIVSSL